MERTVYTKSIEDITFPRVKKDKLLVTIYTQRDKIVGEVYHLPNDRLSDCMNQENQKFLPVTNAEVFELKDNNFEYKVDFLLINKNHVNMIYPIG
jgi:hypothetical protein